MARHRQREDWMEGVRWPGFLRELDAVERAWNSREVHYPREDAVHWMPYAIPQFVSLLTEAVMVAPQRSKYLFSVGPARFLDVGCGPGTKMRLAAEMFGLDTYGIDIVPRFIHEALAYGCKAALMDAFDFPEHPFPDQGEPAMGYAAFDIVYVNRPSGLQDELESLIMDRMSSDAVLVAVNWRNSPGKAGWVPVSEEYGEPVCGVWMKP
jgi:SAM-dependent methyltransferase